MTADRTFCCESFCAKCHSHRDRDGWCECTWAQAARDARSFLPGTIRLYLNGHATREQLKAALAEFDARKNMPQDAGLTPRENT